MRLWIESPAQQADKHPGIMDKQRILDLDQYRIPCSEGLKVPDSLFYIPDFITAEEEAELIPRIDSSRKWRDLSGRRVQNWGGFPDMRVTIGEPLPKWMTPFVRRISELGVFDGKDANHVLVNEYSCGQGIMSHEDGPLFYPTISTINLSSHTVLNLVPKKETVCPNDERVSLLLEPRSLLLIRDNGYTDYLHGINEQEDDVLDDRICNLMFCPGREVGQTLHRGRRISCTIRHVPNMRFDLMNRLIKRV